MKLKCQQLYGSICLITLLIIVLQSYPQANPGKWAAIADKAQEALTEQFWSAQNQYYTHSSDKTGFDYWWNAHALDVLVDGYNRTKNVTYKQQMKALCQGMYRKNNSQWPNEFYDDMEWLALACLRAYDATGDNYYKSIADILWVDIKKGWTPFLEGGILWKKTPPPTKNACSNGPAIILAARFYKLDKQKEDIDWAKKIYDWQYKTLVDTTTGAVADNISMQEGISRVNKKVYTYNLGTWLGGALELFQLTGEEHYLNAAIRSADLVVKDTVNFSPGGILRGENTGDGGLFKGIFIRYFTQLTLQEQLNKAIQKKYIAFLQANGESLVNKATLLPECIFGPDWCTMPARSHSDCSVQLSGIMLLEALDLAGRRGLPGE